MKTKISRKTKQLAGALLVVLAISTILCLTVVGYLSLVEQQNKLSIRSQTWNMAMAIVEAGVEEGLQQLNSNYGHLTTDGWTFDGTWYTRTRTLSDGSHYTVSIDVITDHSAPTIVARANVMPVALAMNHPLTFLATVGVNLQPTTITRAVRVRCSKGDLFTAAMVARRSIDLQGNGVYSDSFDSSDWSKSEYGHYDLDTYSGDRGDIACNGGIESSVSIANANIYGKVHTGPGANVTVGPAGGVGTHEWQQNHNGFQTNYVVQDANFTFPDTTLPDTTGALTPMAGTNVVTTVYNYDDGNTNIVRNTNNYANVLESGRTYTTTNLTGKTVVLGENVTLILPNGLTGVENITFNTGASIKMYVGGTSVTISGNQIFNPNGNASSLILYCAPSVTSFVLNGNGEFVGVLVAPNVDIDMNGGGKEYNDFIGALLVNSVRMNGHFRFHYDEALEDLPPDGRFLITSWDEIP